MACFFLPQSQAVFGSLIVALVAVLLIGGNQSHLRSKYFRWRCLCFWVLFPPLSTLAWGILAVGRWVTGAMGCSASDWADHVISLISFYWVEKPFS